MSYDEVIPYEPWCAPELPEKGDIALDIGACLGIYTLGLARTHRQVWAFEPNPDAFVQLTKNTSQKANVIRCNFALSSEYGYLKLYTYLYGPGLTSDMVLLGVERGAPIGNFYTAAVPLDALPFDGHVSFVKMDTEGAELRILQGARSLLTTHHPKLLIETHGNVPAVRALLEEYGYRARVIRYAFDEGTPYHDDYLWLVAE